jgi:DNA-binding HxlR family transcriptional regulator
MTEQNDPGQRDEDGQAAPRGAAPGGQPPRGVDWEPWERVASVLAAVNSVWGLPVLLCLASGVSRPSDLLHAINADQANVAVISRLRGIQADGRAATREDVGRLSMKVLLETLGRLMDNGLVSRSEVQGAMPRETHYWPTRSGHEVLNELSKVGVPDSTWWPRAMGKGDPPAPPGVDTTKPSIARVWNALLGGRDNFTADREVVRAGLAEMPSLAEAARLTRRFQTDAIHRMVAEGVTQFIDIGTGLPVAGAVHETAQRLDPKSKVVYVDRDPQVLAHARALLRSSLEGSTAVVEADLRDPDTILTRAAETLDLDQPVGILLVAILHFMSDPDDPQGIVRRLTEGIQGDCWLVIAHAGSDIAPASAQAAAREYNERSPVALRLRSREEVSAFFTAADATLLEPGVVPLAQWWAEDLPPDANAHVGMGWRPARRGQATS